MTQRPIGNPAIRLVARYLRDSSAAAAAEFALVVPFFIVLVFGTINTGLAMSAVSQMHYAAERSARCLAVNITTPCTSANINTYARTFYKGPSVSGMQFQASDQTCGKQVIGTANYQILTGIDATGFTITARSCYPII